MAKTIPDAAGETSLPHPKVSEADLSQAVSFSASGITVLQHRADFAAASKALRQPVNSLLVQARARGDQTDGIRVGFTCSKKVGNAVARNRAKRRLRAAARDVLPKLARPGFDYVLIGRADVTADRPYDQLVADLRLALTKLHARVAP